MTPAADAPDADDAACPDCSHPWADHGPDGCLAWPPGQAPCTCRKAPPKDTAEARA